MAISAEVEGIFLQVGAPESNRRALCCPQRDLSRESHEHQVTANPPRARPSLFCTNCALNETGELFGTGLDESVPESIRANFYVGHLLTSSANDVETVKFAKDISASMAHGAFRLLKWTLNSPNESATVVCLDVAATVMPLQSDGATRHRALRVSWDTRMRCRGIRVVQTRNRVGTRCSDTVFVRCHLQKV